MHYIYLDHWLLSGLLIRDPVSNSPCLTLLLTISDASVMRSKRYLLEGLSQTLKVCQHTAILGPNGFRKSTLVKLINRRHYFLADAK